jgi:myosin heavy subunit
VRAIDAAKQRMQALEAEWAAVRRPFDERLAARDGAALRKRERAEAQLRQMQTMRGEIRELAAAARAREEEQRRLLSEYEAAPKSVNRAAFVKRIMEIIKNVKKQEVEIAKITADTREVQRDINAAQEALSRAYALVDETIFRDAKKDDASREAYRLLTSIHSGFADLAARVDETSRSGRTLRDLERKLEELLKRPLDLERIAADLKAVEAENATLGERLAAGTGEA